MAVSRSKVGTLRIQVVPQSASLRLDGSPLEAGSQSAYVAPGNHELEAIAPRYEPLVRQFSAAAGEEVVIELKLSMVGSGKTSEGGDVGLPAWPFVAGIGGAVTVGLLTGGAVLLVRGRDAGDEADALLSALGPRVPGRCLGAARQTCEAIDQRTADKDRDLNTSTGLFIAGAGVGVATIVTSIVLAASDDGDAEAGGAELGEPSAWRLTPRWSPGEVGATATWHW
ncbi:MAG: hypothetical protein AAF580_16020 [Pseudomonadota bacterium]